MDTRITGTTQTNFFPFKGWGSMPQAQEAPQGDGVTLSDAARLSLDGVTLPSPPPKPTSQMTVPEVGLYGDKREGQLCNNLRQLNAIQDPSERQQATQRLAGQCHDPIDLYLMEHLKSSGRSGSDPTTFVNLQHEMQQARGRDVHEGKQVDASLLPRLMVHRGDDKAFHELGSEVRQNLGPHAPSHDVVSTMASLLPSLGLRASTTQDDREAVGRVRKDYPDSNNMQRLVHAGVGNCGEWAYSMNDALEGAGLPSKLMTASWEPFDADGPGRLHNHAAAAFQDEDGHWNMLEPFQYGIDHGGRLDGLGSSIEAGHWRSNSWSAFQASEGKPFVFEEVPSSH